MQDSFFLDNINKLFSKKKYNDVIIKIEKNNQFLENYPDLFNICGVSKLLKFDNNKNDSSNLLTPAAVSGKLDIAIGRVRLMSLEDNVISAFTVGDQLLWGAAEPLRRMLNILIKKES